MARRRGAPKAPPIIERFVKSMVVTAKAVMLYPPASNIPLKTAEDTAAVLSEVLRESPELKLSVNKDGLFYQDMPVFEGNSAYQAFAHELYIRKLSEVRFHAGAGPRDIVAFLSMLRYTPHQIEAAGGFETRLWELGVGTITMSEALVSLVDAGDAESAEIELSREEVDEILASAYAGKNREQMLIGRFLSDRQAVANYLRSTLSSSGSRTLAERFAELAEVACESAGEESRQGLLRTLAEALTDLDAEGRRELLVDELLPEARTNEAVAAAIRQVDLDSMCEMLVQNIDESKTSQEGIARAIRSLALISLADREDVISAVGSAMHKVGLSTPFAAGVIGMTAPSQLTVRERAIAQARADKPVDSILRLMDLAPTPPVQAGGAHEPELASLAEEAERGITDGDVIMALVSLVGYDTRDQQFASTMALLEDSLDLLIERGEIDIAADAADALKAAEADTDLSPEQRQRLGQAVTRFAKPSDVKALARTLRLHEPGSVEHDAARRLLDAMGSLAIDPLLEQLRDEQDMAARKSLVDLLSEKAPDHIAQLGTHIGDSRWYVVRNVVGILGSTKSSAALPYFERTLRHAEKRVRRETIRALSSIADRISHELLILALGDDDAQNVQLAARYLGVAKVRAAVPTLEQVARGEGRGNRDTGPRVEAIESLGMLAATDALPTLEALASRRAIISGSRTKELRAAAESAIARIRGGE